MAETPTHFQRVECACGNEFTIPCVEVLTDLGSVKLRTDLRAVGPIACPSCGNDPSSSHRDPDSPNPQGTAYVVVGISRSQKTAQRGTAK